MKVKWYDITWICDVNLCPLSSHVSPFNRAGDLVGLMTEKLWTLAQVSYFLSFTYNNFYLPNETIYIQPCSEFGIYKECFCALMNYSCIDLFQGMQLDVVGMTVMNSLN